MNTYFSSKSIRPTRQPFTSNKVNNSFQTTNKIMDISVSRGNIDTIASS